MCLFVIGFAMTIGAPSDARKAQTLVDSGVHTTATITGGSTRRFGPGRVESFTVDIEFQDDIGFTVTDSFPYCGDPDTTQAGDKVEIVYDPDDTENVEFAQCRHSTNETVAFFIGLVTLVIGTFAILWRWRTGGWKHRRWGIALMVLGLFFGAASFAENCECKELVYSSAALVVLGTVPQFGRRPDSVEVSAPGQPPPTAP
ncbi:MAG: hypothetical protein QOG54_1316 [Actinomycetota bacterium]|nr:hypothetical protein [Actinomycetota bacterium]